MICKYSGLCVFTNEAFPTIHPLCSNSIAQTNQVASHRRAPCPCQRNAPLAAAGWKRRSAVCRTWQGQRCDDSWEKWEQLGLKYENDCIGIDRKTLSWSGTWSQFSPGFLGGRGCAFGFRCIGKILEICRFQSMVLISVSTYNNYNICWFRFPKKVGKIGCELFPQTCSIKTFVFSFLRSELIGVNCGGRDTHSMNH